MPQSSPSSSHVFGSMVYGGGNLCHITCEGNRLVDSSHLSMGHQTRTSKPLYVCWGGHLPRCTCGGQRVTWSWLSLAMWIPWVELQLSGLARPFPMELCHQVLALHSQRPPSPLKSWWWLKGGRTERLRVFPSAPSVLPSSYRAE